MLPKTLKRCHFSLFSSIPWLLGFVPLLLIAGVTATAGNASSNFSQLGPSSSQYQFYDDGLTGDYYYRDSDFLMEDFLTSYQDETAITLDSSGSLPNLLGDHVNPYKEFPVDEKITLLKMKNDESKMNKSEFVLVASTPSTPTPPIITKRLDEEMLVPQVYNVHHHHHHRHDLIGPPPPIPPALDGIVSDRANIAMGISPTVIVKEIVHGKLASIVATGSPPAAPPLIIPKKITHLHPHRGHKGKPKIPGFDLFDHRKRQYGMIFLEVFKN
ncbi:unnamed protein product [Orchesella dallaii]|uniref:Uncharacterized protein n=1 Tax=Orchesella dallaii TaxID=48710 RepID=A0ABP1RM77_9HEXA